MISLTIISIRYFQNCLAQRRIINPLKIHTFQRVLQILLVVVHIVVVVVVNVVVVIVNVVVVTLFVVTDHNQVNK